MPQRMGAGMAMSGRRPTLILATGVLGGFLLAQLGKQVSTPEPAPAASQEAGPARAPAAGWPSVQPATPVHVPGEEPDVLDTLADILRLDGDFAQTAALYRLLSRADRTNVERLVSETDGLDVGGDRQAALSILFSRYADLDPREALDFLQHRGGSYNDVELRSIFHVWSRRDLEGAVAAAETLEPRLRSIATSAILSSRDDLAMPAQRDIATRLGAPEVLNWLAMERSQAQAYRDPQGALEAVLATAGPTRDQNLFAILVAWARQDPMSAMNAAASLDNAALRHRLQGQVLQEWSRSSPRDAIDWALAQPPSQQSRELASAAITAMAQADPQGAFDVAQGLDGLEGAEALSYVLMFWSQSDPAGAGRAVESIVNPNVRDDAIAQVASGYAQRDPEAALKWASGLTPEDAAQAYPSVFSVLAWQDPATAGELIARLPDGSERNRVAAEVARAWVQSDSTAAARWVDSLVDEDLRAAATRTLVGVWSNIDRDAALRYVEQIPSTAEREAALVEIIQAQSHDAAYSKGLFDQLSTQRYRTGAAKVLYRELRRSDPELAERYRQLAGVKDDTAR